MAKVRPVYEGPASTMGEPWQDLPLDEAVRVLDLSVNQFFSDVNDTLDFDGARNNVARGGSTYLVVEVSAEEAVDTWKAGFYTSPLSIEEALFRLEVHDKLRHAWRDDWQKGEDADGEPAIYLWVALKPERPKAEWSLDRRYQVLRTIQNIWNKSNVPEWVFIRFRQEDEVKAP